MVNSGFKIPRLQGFEVSRLQSFSGAALLETLKPFSP
jgi:hypothetical protein